MPTGIEGILVERLITIDASPDTVWEFLVDPTLAVRWMGLAASFDPMPGGTYRVEVVPGQVARGEFVEIDQPRRLVLTWGWEPESRSPVTPGQSTVEFDLTPCPEGTLLRLTRRDLPNADARTAHAHGWSHYLGRLASVASGADPGIDPWVEAPDR